MFAGIKWKALMPNLYYAERSLSPKIWLQCADSSCNTAFVMRSIVYRGRFAPSPTGPLHFGSLVAALGSYLDARSIGGEWLLRLEDSDSERSVPGAADQILHTLEALGFTWDGAVLKQSERRDVYEHVLTELRRKNLIYRCTCSRKKQLQFAHALGVDGSPIYPGWCRNNALPHNGTGAWRLRVTDMAISINDRIQGTITQVLADCVGDFVLQRADGLIAYQLAVVADDAAQGITDIVRGADLLDSTPRQVWLQRCLGMPQARYAHLPIACSAVGDKLSKQTWAPAIQPQAGTALLVAASRFLGQTVPEDLRHASLSDFWAWAIPHWSIEAVPRLRSRTVDPSHSHTNQLITQPTQTPC